MRRFLFLALVAASLLPGPLHAQATADQLNRLSLEALTANRPSGGGGGYAGRSYHRSYAAPRYATRSRRYGYAGRRSYARYTGGYRVRRYAARPYYGRNYSHVPQRRFTRAYTGRRYGR